MTQGQTRTDLVSVVIAGDIGAYALGREMHEAFGIRSICVAPLPIGAIRHSKIFDWHRVESLSQEHLRDALRDIAAANAGKTVFVLSNADPIIAILSRLAAELPDNLVMCMPPAEVVDLVSDKVEFARLCEQNGLEAPLSLVARCGGDEAWPVWEKDFPLVLKPAYSPEYAAYIARGFQKVYYVQSQQELEGILTSLREAGFAGDMLVQELIEGDDTWMDSITLYLDQRGECTLFGSARVLLEDHAPAMLGNPVAMITQQVPELWQKTSQMLKSVGYRGFANFDIKRDPKHPGRYVFFEVNPRIGRNSFYNLAAGVNPVELAVRDLVDHEAVEPQTASDKVLYTLVPVSLLRKYVRDPQLLEQVNGLVKKGLVFDPQRYKKDWGLRRALDVELTEKNQIRKFSRYYPEPTDTSF